MEKVGEVEEEEEGEESAREEEEEEWDSLFTDNGIFIL